jgi:hypothetical protein
MKLIVGKLYKVTKDTLDHGADRIYICINPGLPEHKHIDLEKGNIFLVVRDEFYQCYTILFKDTIGTINTTKKTYCYLNVVQLD